MRLFFEDYDKLDLRSEVYNALTDIAFEYNSKGFSVDEIKAAFNEALDWFDTHFWEDEDLDECFTSSFNEAKDLSTVDGSITKVLKDHELELRDIENKDDLMNRVVELFRENNIDTKKSREIIKNMSMKKSLEALQFYVWNVMLKGQDAGVIKTGRSRY